MDAAPRTPSTKRFLLLLVVLAAALLALAMAQRDRTLQQVYDDAQRRAALYTGTVLRSALRPGDVVGTMGPDRSRAILADVQGFVLTDPAVVRVRLWTPDGRLLFSTDPADSSGATTPDPAIAVAASGRLLSRLGAERLTPPSGASGPSEVPLFQTFAPLRIRDGAGVVGASEIEQSASVLQDRADDPWWLVQIVASAVTVFLALLAFISVARGMRRPRPAKADRGRGRRRERGAGGFDAERDDLRERLERATARAQEAETAAHSFAERLKEVSSRLERVEKQSPDERAAELKEALRRSEAERAMLRAGRPETAPEAEARRLRSELREATARAKAADALAAGGEQLAAIQRELSTAARDVEAAVERAKVAEGRADAAEDRAQAAGDLVTAAEQRIDLLEAKLQEIAAAGVVGSHPSELLELQRLLDEANANAAALERRAIEAESRLVVDDAPSDALLAPLEERLVAAEERAKEAEARIRAVEDQGSEREAAFRQRLGISSSGRKYGGAAQPDEIPEPNLDVRAAIARGIRGPLTRATGLVLSLQGAVQAGEGKEILRQLSSSLRRLDRLAADLHDVDRIIDGSLPLNRRRTDLGGLVQTTVDETDRLEDRLVRVIADRVHASVDADRVRQIVEGMLDAARERTRSGAAIAVRVSDTDAGARISVEDDNRTPAVVGAELGLAVRLAELHGTQIVADGSSYRVIFPKDER